jgi:hypothetical protein
MLGEVIADTEVAVILTITGTALFGSMALANALPSPTLDREST